MNFLLQFAHAGHNHEEPSGDDTMLIILGSIVVVFITVALILFVINKSKNAAEEITKDTLQS